MTVKIKLLTETAKVPTAGSDGAAGRDLYADIRRKTTIRPGAMKFIPTGISIELPLGCFGAIYPRSGLASKSGLRLANCTAVIDEDYRGEIIVAMYNDSDIPQVVTKGMRIAQLVIQRYEEPEFEVVKELSDTNRGDNGFGSSGE